MSIKKGIDKTCAHLVAKLKEHAKPVKGRTDIKVFLIEQEHRMGKHRIEIFTI
jgi:chaperonin GroEL (HSP60 family)